MNENKDLLSITAFCSALVHAVIILGVGFSMPDIAQVENTDNQLDVVLVNKSNNEKAEDAKTVSSSDNLGGGSDEREASSPLPYKTVNPSEIQSAKLTANQQQQTSLSPDQLLTASNGNVKIQRVENKITKIESKQKTKGKDKITTTVTTARERERLIAKLAQEWADYQKRPNKEFLSPSTKSNEAAQYLDTWRKKVEKVGNANYPVKARAEGLSGSLIVSVEINRNGTIAAVNIDKPSPHKVLNDAALRFVRNAAPYPAFPDEIDPNTDILVITRAFHFSNNNVTSTDASSYRNR